MHKHRPLLWFLLAVLIGSILLPAKNYARVTLADPASGRVILSAIIGEGEEATLTWTNSIFRIPVREVFTLEGGSLHLHEIASGNVQGDDNSSVTSADVEDLYHTGDEFYSDKMDRLFQRIVFRVGEIGAPHFQVGNYLVDFKQEVGFGGQIILEVQSVRMYEVLLSHVENSLPR